MLFSMVDASRHLPPLALAGLAPRLSKQYGIINTSLAKFSQSFVINKATWEQMMCYLRRFDGCDHLETMLQPRMKTLGPTCKYPILIISLQATLFSISPQLEIRTWHYNEYADPKDATAPPSVMAFSDIHCQVSRGQLKHLDPPVWVTTTMDRVSAHLKNLPPRSLIISSFSIR